MMFPPPKRLLEACAEAELHVSSSNTRAATTRRAALAAVREQLWAACIGSPGWSAGEGWLMSCCTTPQHHMLVLHESAAGS